MTRQRGFNLRQVASVMRPELLNRLARQCSAVGGWTGTAAELARRSQRMRSPFLDQQKQGFSESGQRGGTAQ